MGQNSDSDPSAPGKLGRTTLPARADQVQGAAALPWYLFVAYPAKPEAVFTLSAAQIHIGREEVAGVDLVLPDPAVSRVHAVLRTFPGEDSVWVQDRDSSNGVFLNGRRIEGAAARAGDVLRIGDTVLVLGRGTPAKVEEERDLDIVGRSPRIVELREVVRKIAPSTLPVIVLGPTGTGKELVAEALHTGSGRRGPLVAVNCAALPATLVESVLFGHTKGAFTGATSDHDGAFVQADGGTLFLDEVGDLPAEAQPKLLRALENGQVVRIGATEPRTVDVRVVAATHVALDAALDEGRFRRDLYARLAGVIVRTPSLAERREDVALIFQSFLPEGDARPSSADFVESLLLHDWPFNVRELRRLAERLAVLHGDAERWERGMLDEGMRAPGLASTPPAGASPAAAASAASIPPGPPRAAAAPEPRKGPPPREELIALLEKCGGNVSRVAELTGRNRKQVYRWLEQYELEPGIGRKE